MSNEITIKIDLSDNLLNKITNMLLVSNSQLPMAVPVAQVSSQPKKEATPIGFKK
tara:strand:+ start:480 stop:644 length:165 start_codon:yes stop_codon:yes gene_type:complete